MRSVRRAAHRTWKPAAARARAVAAPMPLEAPVTTAVRAALVGRVVGLGHGAIDAGCAP